MVRYKRLVLIVFCMFMAAGALWVKPAAASSLWDSVADFGSWVQENSGWEEGLSDLPMKMAESFIAPKALDAVPIPGTAVLLGSGLASLLGLRSRKGRKLLERFTRKDVS